MDSSGGPIHSRLDDDPAFAEAIDRFVVALAERVDDLQDIELRGDMTRLAERVGALGAEAQQVGYESLRRSAEEVANAARERNGDLVYKSLIELTDLARRIRQGHRGAL